MRALRGSLGNKSGYTYGFAPSHVTAIWGSEHNAFLLVDGEKVYIGESVIKVAKELGLRITGGEK
jgi:hypothetical protein